MSEQRVQTAIGVISGTSMDGIDVALIRSDGETRVEAGPAATFPYPEPLARALRAVVASPSEAEKPQVGARARGDRRPCRGGRGLPPEDSRSRAKTSRSPACTGRRSCTGRAPA